MQTISYSEQAGQALATLSRGAFLTVEHGGKRNTMTIGWGSVGFMWGKPVFTVLVRPSRYTYQLIEQSGEFTVSIPQGDMQQALALCGSMSGRDTDKFSAANLAPLAGRKVAVPVIAGCSLYYECKVICKQTLLPAAAGPELGAKWYPDGDYHTMYFGEILATYNGD